MKETFPVLLQNFSQRALENLISHQYDEASSTTTNVVKNITDLDVIFIHGESLVEYLINDLKWSDLIPQVLPLIFRVEKFLKIFHEVRCQIKIFFFDSDYIAKPKIWRLMRDIVKFHIENNTFARLVVS